MKIIRTGMFFVMVLGIILGLSFKKEDMQIEVVVERVDRREHLEPYPFYAVLYAVPGRNKIVLDRVNMIETCPDIWAKIEEGQTLILHHRAMAFGSFIFFHKDVLEKKE